MGLGPQVVVLICIISAGFTVLCGWAMTRFFFTTVEPPIAPSAEQAAYMRETRLRNQALNHFEARFGMGKMPDGPARAATPL